MGDDTDVLGACLPEVKALAAGFTVLGAVLLATVVVLSPRHLQALVGAAVFAATFTVVSWLVARRWQLRMWATAARVDRHQPLELDRRGAYGRGLTMSLFVTTAEVVLVLMLARAWGLQDVSFVAGIVLSLAALQAIWARELSRWEADNNLVMCRRTRPRRIAWTPSQAMSRFVAVAAHT